MDKINQIIEKVNKIPGFFNKAQMEILYPIVIKLDPGSLLVEIGTYHGKSTRFYSLVNPKVKILTIDLVGFPEVPGRPGVKIDEKVLHGGNIFQVLGDNAEIVRGFNWKIDLLFIDGNHLREEVKKDTTNWEAHVGKGGYIVFHDYEPTHNGVIKAVDEWMENNKEFAKFKADAGMFIVRRKI